MSADSCSCWLEIDACREWVLRKGEEARGILSVELERRDWNRRSKGRKEGVGLEIPGREATEGRILLPGDEIMEP